MRQRIDQRSGSCSASEMVPGQGDASARRRSCGKATWISGDMIRVLADLQDSGMIYFQGSLARSEGHNDHKFGTDVELALPPAFLREHGDKFEDYVVFWTRSSTKPWVVQVSIFEEPDGAVDVKFADGWDEFAADNRLKPGDSLIFVLNVPQPEFMVYIFQGTGMSSRASARNTDNRTRLSKQTWRSLSDGHRKHRQKNGRKTGGLLIGKKAVQETRQRNLGASFVDKEYKTNFFPHFEKRITATDLKQHSIEVPASFVKTHGMKLNQAEVQVQGIHHESPVRTVRLCWDEQFEAATRVFLRAGWSNFMKENGLHKGQELRFTMTAASFFIVREV